VWKGQGRDNKVLNQILPWIKVEISHDPPFGYKSQFWEHNGFSMGLPLNWERQGRASMVQQLNLLLPSGGKDEVSKQTSPLSWKARSKNSKWEFSLCDKDRANSHHQYLKTLKIERSVLLKGWIFVEGVVNEVNTRHARQLTTKTEKQIRRIRIS